MSIQRYASPLRYPGGKSQLAPFLIKVVAANNLERPHYVEPYAGGAGAALHLLFEEYVRTVTINDADDHVRAFWHAVTKQNDRFVERLSTISVSVTQWQRQRAIYKRCDLRKLFELGFATFYLNRTSRSGIVRNGGPIGGLEQGGEYKVDARFYRDQLCDRIARIGRYSDRISISGVDGLELLREIEGDAARARRTFVFLDPPYYNKGAQLYLNGFDHEQHQALAAYLSRRRRFRWVMTYDNVKPIRELYRDFASVGFDLSYSAFEYRAGRELLIYPEETAIPGAVRSALRSVA